MKTAPSSTFIRMARVAQPGRFRRDADVPRLWIVGGPNGSGKSTLIASGALSDWIGASLAALSPDDIVLRLRTQHADWSEENLLLAAQLESDRAVDDAIATGQDVMVETVLSSSKFERRVEAALAAGFEFGFVFVTVAAADLNIERVKDRVELGGHDVPEDRLRARRERSHAAATWFAAPADLGVFYDNSGEAPVPLAEKRRGQAGWRILRPETLAMLDLRMPG